MRTDETSCLIETDWPSGRNALSVLYQTFTDAEKERKIPREGATCRNFHKQLMVPKPSLEFWVTLAVKASFKQKHEPKKDQNVQYWQANIVWIREAPAPTLLSSRTSC
jgi:hypothetical protein